MLRDSKGRFCKAKKELNTKVKSNKIPFLSKKHTKDEENFGEWSDLGKGIEKALKELDTDEPIVLHIKIRNSDAIDLDASKVEEDRFDDCVNNACIFDRLDWDERAKFMDALFDNGKRDTEICEVMSKSCTVLHPTPLKDGSGSRIMPCAGCFTDWFFNYFTPEVFHKILGD